LIIDFVLEPNNTTLGEVTVSSTLRHNTDASTTREQKEAHVTMTGVNEQHIKRTQDKDAGEVIRRIPGCEHHRREVRDGARALTTI